MLRRLQLSPGYRRAELYGDRAVQHRGGLLDVGRTTQTTPVRIELFDDDLDSIRAFDVESQRSPSRFTRPASAGREVMIGGRGDLVAECFRCIGRKAEALREQGADGRDALELRVGEISLHCARMPLRRDGVLPATLVRMSPAAGWLPSDALVLGRAQPLKSNRDRFWRCSAKCI